MQIGFPATAGVGSSIIRDSGSARVAGTDIMGSTGLLKAVPLPSHTQPGDVVQRLEDIIRALPSCQSAAEIRSICDKIGVMLSDHYSITNVSDKSDIVKTMSEAMSALKEKGQTVKANRIGKMMELYKKLTGAKPKKQAKILREIVRLSGLNVGAKIAKRGLCGRGVWCNAACLVGTTVLVAGATTLVALAATGSLGSEIAELEQNQAGVEEYGEENGVEDPEHSEDRLQDKDDKKRARKLEKQNKKQESRERGEKARNRKIAKREVRNQTADFNILKEQHRTIMDDLAQSLAGALEDENFDDLEDSINSLDNVNAVLIFVTSDVDKVTKTAFASFGIAENLTGNILDLLTGEEQTVKLTLIKDVESNDGTISRLSVNVKDRTVVDKHVYWLGPP